MKSADVFVIGEALIDIVQRGVESTAHPGGSPANVALGLGRLGRSVDLLTHLGRDERGGEIERWLRASAVNLLDQSFSADRTSIARASIGADGDSSYTFDIEWSVPRGVESAPRVLHTGSIAAFLKPGADDVANYLEESSAAEVTFDPNIRPALVGDHSVAIARFERLASFATCVKLSDEDAGWLYPGSRIPEVVDALLGLGPNLVVVTMGARGMRLATPLAEVFVAAEPVALVDTVGAGDTVMASLIDSLLDYPSNELAADRLQAIGIRATRAAAVTVSRAGADLPYRQELDSR
jgi:fructokinase